MNVHRFKSLYNNIVEQTKIRHCKVVYFKSVSFHYRTVRIDFCRSNFYRHHHHAYSLFCTLSLSIFLSLPLATFCRRPNKFRVNAWFIHITRPEQLLRRVFVKKQSKTKMFVLVDKLIRHTGASDVLKNNFVFSNCSSRRGRDNYLQMDAV